MPAPTLRSTVAVTRREVVVDLENAPRITDDADHRTTYRPTELVVAIDHRPDDTTDTYVTLMTPPDFHTGTEYAETAWSTDAAPRSGRVWPDDAPAWVRALALAHHPGGTP